MEKKKSLRILFAGILSAIAMTLCVIGAACAKDEPQSDGRETGVYYNDQSGTEYLLTLYGGERFTLTMDGTTAFGNYLIDSEALSLVVSEEETLPAIYSGDTIVLDYHSVEIRFLKKIDYRVEFNTNGGNALSGKTVVNGKSLEKPQDPVREGYAFLGWYADAELKTPYQFGAGVTENLTLYARWAEKQVGQREYTLSFDWNLPEAELGAAGEALTVGGKLYEQFLPQVPQVEGYRFEGWWVSMLNEGDKLSYQYTENLTFGENTTLFALWQSTSSNSKLSAPLVNVSEKQIAWNGATGVQSYKIQVTSANGAPIVPETEISSTSLNAVDFANYPAGDYQITVTAIASDASNNSDPAIRYYRNKALKRVSLVEIVEPALLTFQGVENATEYAISVSCGNPEHNHDNFSIQNSTYFSFVNCDMKEGGITYTITAKANGYASSTSQVFVYNRELRAIDSLRYDGATQTLVWNAVEKATNYFVSVNGGDFTDNGSATSFSLKEFDGADGKLEVKVYPATKGYNSPAASTLMCEKTGLSAPKNLRMTDGDTLAWDSVAGASSYEVKIGSKTETVTDTQINLSEKFALVEGDTYSISVKAKSGESESLYSNEYVATYLTLGDLLAYRNGTLYWTPVLGADGIELSINGGDYVPLDKSASSAEVTLTQAGYNTFSVRFIKNGVASRAISTQVYAYTITFNSNLGTPVPAQYKAMGDEVELTPASKQNYEFEGWYNIASGAAGNGLKFDGNFAATGDVTLYAYYLPKAFTVTYSFGKHGFGDNPTAQVKYRESFKLEVPVSTQPTQMFGGWFTGENGTGAQLTDIYGNSLNVWTTPSNATVYAYWIDDVLRFELTSFSKEDVYKVSPGSSRQTEITVPATYNGLSVAVITADAFYNCSAKIINIPDTIRSISSAAFTKCDNLEAVNIYHVEGNNAIRYYSHEGVLYDYGALDDQPDDKTWLTSTLQFYPRNKKSDNYEIPDRVTTIASGAFEHVSGEGLLAVTVPASVTYIANQAFSRKDIQTITIKDPVIASTAQNLTVSDNAFYQCGGLKTLNLPARLQKINTTTFVYGRTDLGSPAATSIGTGVTDGVPCSFYMCGNLEELNVAAGCKAYSSIDGVLYNADKSTILYVPANAKTLQENEGEFIFPASASVSTINRGAFLGNSTLKKINIPFTVTNIGECAFYSSGLTQVTFGGGAIVPFDAVIGKYAFRGCSKLQTVTFESGCTPSSLNEGAFMDCSSLGAVTIPASMKTIGDQAFRNCSSLATLGFAESQNDLSFGDFVFTGCSSLKTVTLPKNATSVPSFGGVALERVEIAAGNPYLKTVNDVVFDKNETILYFYPADKKDTAYAIPASVKTIAAGAFQGALNLTSINIGANVETIGDSAFSGCEALQTITFAQDGTRNLIIGSSAFQGCAASEIDLPSRVTTIGSYAFADMENLDTFALKSDLNAIPDGMLMNTAITSFTVTASVKSIGEDAFYGSRLNQITFASGSTLTFIGNTAFAQTALTAFNLPDSVEMIDDYAFYGTKKLTEFNIGTGSQLKTIGYAAFAYGALEQIFIPKNVTTIRPAAFSKSNLSAIAFAQDGTEDLSIGAYYERLSGSGSDVWRNREMGEVFAETDLEEVHFPARLTELGGNYKSESDGIFYNCTKLTTVTFAPQGEDSRLICIPDYLFYKCTSLKSITIPKSVKDNAVSGDPTYDGSYRFAINGGAFGNCTALEEIIMEKGNYNTFTIAAYVFADDYGRGKDIELLTSFTFPERLQKVFDGAFAKCSNIQYYSINGDEEDGNTNFVYGAYDGLLYSPDFREVLLCPSARDAEHPVTLHPETQAIHENAFKGCTGIAKITIPAGMDRFNASALADCDNLSEIAVEGEGGKYAAEGGMLYNGDKTELLYVPSQLFGETMGTYDITLPATLQKIGDSAFYGITELKSISFEDITNPFEIGDSAFYGCTGLTEINLPQSLTTLGAHAFENCTELETLAFAKGCQLQAIPAAAFVNCSSLTELKLPAAVKSISAAVVETVLVWDDWYEEWDSEKRMVGAFHGCESLESITFEEGSVLETIGSYAFETDLEWDSYRDEISSYPDHESSIVTIELPDSVTEIGEYAFYDLVSLKEVTLPQNLLVLSKGMFWYCQSLEKVNYSETAKKNILPVHITVIGDDAFYYCKKLLSMEIGPNVTSIGYAAFAKCETMESINIPKSVIELRVYEGSDWRSYDGMFYGCTSLKTVDLQTSSASLPKYMFYGCSALTEIEIPSTVERLGDWCFNNTGLTSITIPASITNISMRAFSGCKSLATVILHESVQSIGSYAFDGAPITKIATSADATENALPDSIQTIGTNAFQNCAELASIKLPSSLTRLESYVFNGCTKLASVTLPEALTSIGRSCFQGTGLTSFTLPAKVTEIPQQMLAGCTSLDTLTLHDNVTAIGVGAFMNTAIKNFTLPAKITAVPQQMLYNCTQLTSVTWNDKVTSIGYGAFSKTGLTSVALPATLTTISDGYASSKMGAFSECANLASVTLNTALEKIGSYAFYGCEGLTTLNMNGNDKLTSVGEYAFANTGITAFEIPATVTSFDPNAFAECDVTLSVAEGNKSFKLVGNTMYNADETKILFFVGTVTEFTWTKGIAVSRGAFNGATLNTVTVKAGATVDDYAFEYANIKELIVEAGTFNAETKTYTDFATLGDYAFQYATIEKVTIGDGTVVGKESSSYARTFYFAKLGAVTIGKNVTLNNYLFERSTSITDSDGITIPMTVTFGDGVNFKGKYMFYNSDVTALTFGENVTINNSEAFYYATKVTSVFIPKSMVLNGSWVFDQWSDSTIYMEATEAEVKKFVEDKVWNSSWKSGCYANILYGQTNPNATGEETTQGTQD